MKELYLSHSRMREFRGQIRYSVESSFLRELPESVERVDQSMSRNFARSAADSYRAKIADAANGWAETTSRPALPPVSTSAGNEDVLEKGVVVQHEEYGIGSVTDVTGYGALKRVKIRFPSSGEKVFVANKVKLKVVTRKIR